MGTTIGAVAPVLLGGAAMGPVGTGIGAAMGAQHMGIDLGQTLGTKDGFVANQAPVMQPTTIDQANQAQLGVNSALTQQQQFAQAMGSQNGIGAQTQARNMALQQALGQGPSAAQAQLANATGANNANQAALMAGQRGAGANAGLMARQAAMQGGANSQNMAGQAAALRAQEQLAGQQNFANIANQQAQGFGNAANSAVQGQLGSQSNILGSIANQNNAVVNAVGGANAQNAAVSAGNVNRNTQLIGGLMGGAGAVMGLANGGAVPDTSVGGMGGRSNMYKCMKSGGAVPGQAKVAGDSAKNDTVKALLSPGEVVIPRSVMQSKNPAEAAARFVAAVLAKNGTAQSGK